jgi:MoxR-like ATPase
LLCGKARALLRGRFHVLPEDLEAVAAPVLRHRILRNFQAEAEGISTDEIVEAVLAHVQRPRSGL